MSGRTGDPADARVLVLAPTPRDASLTQGILSRAGVACACYPDLAAIGRELIVGAGALLLPEEALADDEQEPLARWLANQPPWSDLPVLVLARSGADSAAVAEAMEHYGNVAVLERPMRVSALVSAVRTALRARLRQYQIRDHLVEIERGFEAESRLAAIVASSDDAIISKTLDGSILTWNDGAVRVFGYTAEEAVGRPITMVIPPERLDEERVLLQRLRRGERIDHFETVRLRKDGQRIDVSLTVSPVRNSEGVVVAASKVARDITAQKRAEQALREADRRKDEFLAVLAHELRNPLAPIRNSLHILRLTAADPTTERVGEMMERQVNHMVRLVDDLLEVSRITRGKIDLRPESIEMGSVIRSAVEASRPLIEAAGHRLSIAVPTDPIVVRADPVRLAQVLANLLNNAAKYTEPKGLITLTVRREGPDMAVSVKDSGIGIPRAMLSRIFDMFTQVDREGGRSQGGLGIGLTLVKSLVELHGGTVDAISEGPGKGSEFVVRLPIESNAPADAMPSGSAPAMGVPTRVLVVDDNRDAAESLGMLLKLLGATVQVAYGGADALRVMHRFKPTVVLLDLGMPDMSGLEVAREIRRRPEWAKVTLVALSGWGQAEDRKRSELAGFDHHFIKPGDVDALQALLLSLENGKHADHMPPTATIPEP